MAEYVIVLSLTLGWLVGVVVLAEAANKDKTIQDLFAHPMVELRPWLGPLILWAVILLWPFFLCAAGLDRLVRKWSDDP